MTRCGVRPCGSPTSFSGIRSRARRPPRRPTSTSRTTVRTSTSLSTRIIRTRASCAPTGRTAIGHSGDDVVSVYFDTFLDQQRAYVFSVNGYGVQMDSIMNARGGGGGGGGGRGGSGRRGGGFSGGGFSGIPRGDSTWDALFESGGQLVADGFTAEMAIPFKSLRYPQRDRDVPHRWGFQIVREIRGKDENVVWSPFTRDIAGLPAADGRPRRDVEPLDEPQHRDPADVYGDQFRVARHRHRRLQRARHVARGRCQLQVRRDVEPDGRLRVQSRLLTDRVRPAADRGQPALRALLPRAPPVFSRGG